MNLEKQYNDLINSYENEILLKLKELETDHKYNLYYNMLIDLFNYIELYKNRSINYTDYYNILFNINFNSLDLNNIYNSIIFKEYLKEKYDKNFNIQIIKENNILYLIDYIIKDNNTDLFNKLKNIDINNLDLIIKYILEFLLNEFLTEFKFNNDYLEFLRILNNNFRIIKDIIENYY